MKYVSKQVSFYARKDLAGLGGGGKIAIKIIVRNNCKLDDRRLIKRLSLNLTIAVASLIRQ